MMTYAPDGFFVHEVEGREEDLAEVAAHLQPHERVVLAAVRQNHLRRERNASA
jgi:hypothetical protein